MSDRGTEAAQSAGTDDIAARLAEGQARHQAGDIDAARDHYLAVLERDPDNPEGNFLAALLCHQCAEHEAARHFIERASAARPGDARVHNTRGSILLALGRAEEARSAFHAAIDLDPNLCDASLNLALTERALGNLSEAAAILRRAIEEHGDVPDARRWLGVVLSDLGNDREALAELEAAADAQPEDWRNYLHLGRVLRRMRDWSLAERCLRRALDLAPEGAAARWELAELLAEQGDEEAALALFQELARAVPDQPDPWTRIAEIESRRGNLEPAIAAATRAVEQEPGQSKAQLVLADLRYKAGDPAAACDAAREAARSAGDDPEVQVAVAGYELATGHLAEGWAAWEGRLRLPSAVRRVGLPSRWNGDDLAGKRIAVLLEPEPWIALQFADCVGEVVERAALCILECDPRLMPLFRRSFPSAECGERVWRTDFAGRRTGNYDWLLPHLPVHLQIEIGSLPRFLRQSADAFPTSPRLLQPDAQRVRELKSWLEGLGGGKTVGLALSDDEGSLQDGGTLELDSLAPLLDAAGIRFVLLGGDANGLLSARLAGRLAWPPVQAGDSDARAALMAALDAIVAVPGQTAHLAGAIGATTSLLTSPGAPWTWQMRRGPANLWYPSVTSVEPSPTGDWRDAAARLAHRLTGG